MSSALALRPGGASSARAIVRPVIAALVAVGISASGGTAATGTDSTGYVWVDTADGAVADTAAFDTTPTTINPADDALPIEVTLPFTFPFYRQPYDSIWISDNGWYGFDGPYGSAHGTPATRIPDGSAPDAFVAPFWSQMRHNVTLGTYLRYGPALGGTAFLIEVFTRQPATGTFIEFRVLLFYDGAMEFQYPAGVTSLAGATIGIENETGTDGCEIVGGGTPATGVPAVFPSGYVVEFRVPPVLPGRCGTFPSIACPSATAGMLPGPPPSVLVYGCSGAVEAAAERVYNFTLAQLSVVDLSVTAGTASNLALHLLDACDERRCIRGPATSLSAVLGPGTYHVSVDAPDPSDEGTYTLNFACRPFATPVACGGRVTGNNTGVASSLDGYTCAAGRDLSGGEVAYRVTLTSTTNIHATLSGTTEDLDVLVMSMPTGELRPDACLGWGDDEAVGWNLPPGDYLVVVDGVAGAESAFTLDVSCRVDLQCTTLAGTVDFVSGRVVTLTGDTSSGSDSVESYSCAPGQVLDGPELVYAVVMPQAGHVSIMPEAGLDLTYVLLSACNDGTCVGVAGAGTAAGCGADLSAGLHYLVIDSPAGDEQAFELLLAYEQPFNRWSVCERPAGVTQPTDTSSTTWNFDDGAFCWDVPESYNYPNGCTFAMYLTARCGTELHIPLFDSESGHVRIFDVFRGEYVVLTATSTGGWFMQSTDIQWDDPDCTGFDTRWNEQVTDISFDRPEGLCGVYRLEFINHSGFVWELYSNCTGDQAPGFNIHDSACTAIADYKPLPAIALVRATATYNCPQITVTYTLQNDGCAPAVNFPVTLLDGGNVVHEELVPLIQPGETVIGSFTTTFTTVPTVSVQLENDPDGVTLECDEVSSSGCGLRLGTEIAQLAGCGLTCQVIAQADVTPTRICVGEAVSIDGSSSFASLCPGNTLEYRLLGPGLPGTFQASALFTGIAPPTTTTYTLEARCIADQACVASQSVLVRVDRPPDFLPSAVQAADVSSCNPGIQVSWAPATFHGGSSVNYYNIYRSEVSCAAALASGMPHGTVSTPATTFDDPATVIGTPYYYVVEAEDGALGSVCPTGPRGGAATSVDANGGTCIAVVDDVVAGQPDQLPRVGTSLRLGGDSGGGIPRYGPTFVELTWTTNQPLSAGEHFHVLRSDRPDANFLQRNTEPPYITTGRFTDLSASHAVTKLWFYLVFTADECELDNRDFDSFTTQP